LSSLLLRAADRRTDVDHIPIIRELLSRNILRQPPQRPRYLDDPRAIEALKRVKQASGVLNLIGSGRTPCRLEANAPD